MKHITLVFICCLAATLATTFARKIPDIARPHPDPTPPPGYEPAIQDDRCKNVASSKFLPHESDCSSFYECKNGLRYTRNCPSGLNYDFVNQVCQLPGDSFGVPSFGILGCPLYNARAAPTP